MRSFIINRTIETGLAKNQIRFVAGDRDGLRSLASRALSLWHHLWAMAEHAVVKRRVTPVMALAVVSGTATCRAAMCPPTGQRPVYPALGGSVGLV